MDRFAPKYDIDPDSECWVWNAHRNAGGYGTFKRDGRMVLAHRASYELHVGPIPEGLVIDHLCRNRACVNPDHLEPVTSRLNILRGVGMAARNVQKTACPSGHEYTPENTRLYRGWRFCRACDRDRHARTYRARKVSTS